jgi:TonB family protein
MPRTAFCVILLAAAASVTAQTHVSFWPVMAEGTGQNGCFLVRNEDDLESRLSQAGWNGKTDIPYIFPPLVRAGEEAAKIAAVVTAADHFERTNDVKPDVDQTGPQTYEITISLVRVEEENSGVFVVKLDPKYASVKTCVAGPASQDNETANATTGVKETISTNSAGSGPALKNVSQKVAQQHLLKRIDPEFPSDAEQKHLKGPVTLHIEIGKDGDVTAARLSYGDPALERAAIAAVRQWKFDPFLVNGQAIKAATDVQVNFKPNDQDDDDN